MNSNINKEDKEEIIDYVYNQVIQEYSHLAEEYDGDLLQEKIMEIVDKEVELIIKKQSE